MLRMNYLRLRGWNYIFSRVSIEILQHESIAIICTLHALIDAIGPCTTAPSYICYNDFVWWIENWREVSHVRLLGRGLTDLNRFSHKCPSKPRSIKRRILLATERVTSWRRASPNGKNAGPVVGLLSPAMAGDNNRLLSTPMIKLGPRAPILPPDELAKKSRGGGGDL
jgi:hypothetical protein